jgi:hypothetical protein
MKSGVAAAYINLHGVEFNAYIIVNDVKQIIEIMLCWVISDIRKSEGNSVRTTGNPPEIRSFCLPIKCLGNHRYTILLGPRSNCVPPEYRSDTVRVCQLFGS